ncbi:hypothetical protein [Gaopeijia maritima]|uniref:Alpha/beta hydrolase n=1 Tax=Gaopeijia maritima TaxID=3119007 RepID=A0ABU9E8D3_9BACT
MEAVDEVAKVDPLRSLERRGEGPAVLVLGVPLDAMPDGYRFLGLDGRGLDGLDGDRRLGEAIEALGLESPVIVVAGHLASTALRLTLRDPWRVGGLAMLFAPDPGRPAGVSMRATLDPLGVPLVLLPLAGAIAAAMERVALGAFLDTCHRDVARTR